MAHTGGGEAGGEDAGPEVDVVLVAPAAVDVDRLQRFQTLLESRNQVDGVVALPTPPALRDRLAGLEVEGDAEAEWGARIGVVGRGHAEVHDGVALRGRELFLAPDALQKSADAAIVLAIGEPFV